MAGRSSTRKYRSPLTRPLWPAGNPESATSSGAFTPPAQTNTPPSTSWPPLSRKPSSVAAAIAALVRTWTPRSERILVALSISCREEPARTVGPASTSTTPGPPGQVDARDLGRHEADPLGQHGLERDAHRLGGAGAAGDPGQLGEHLVVVVPVDQG